MPWKQINWNIVIQSDNGLYVNMGVSVQCYECNFTELITFTLFNNPHTYIINKHLHHFHAIWFTTDGIIVVHCRL